MKPLKLFNGITH